MPIAASNYLKTKLVVYEEMWINTLEVACVQTLLISFQRDSPPVESAHRRPGGEQEENLSEKGSIESARRLFRSGIGKKFDLTLSDRGILKHSMPGELRIPPLLNAVAMLDMAT